MDPQIIETILNLVYFLVGLAVGVFGLWQNQKYFQAQQQDKFDQISAELREIRERLAIVAESTSERAIKREDQLFNLAIQQAVVDTATGEATADIRAVVIEELQQAGVPNAIQRTMELEEKVTRIVARSAERVVAARQDAELYVVLSSLPENELVALRDVGEQWFIPGQVKASFVSGYSTLALYGMIARWRKAEIVERSEKGAYRVRPSVREMLSEMSKLDYSNQRG